MTSKFLITVLLIAGCLATSPPKCPTNYIPTALGCAESCSSPTYYNCPNFFPLLYRPSFCGLKQNGKWQSFTYACQACAQGCVAVKDGKCGCDVEPCQSGYKCWNNQCELDRPVCPNNFVNSSMGCIEACSSPTYSNCPDVFPALYNPSFCGLRADGRWQSFTYACQACKQGFVGVKSGKCGCDVEPCQSGYKCQNNQCVFDRPTCPTNYVNSSMGCIEACSSPTYSNCPNVFNLLYNPSFCGLRADGKWQSFTYACQACKQGFVGVKSGKCGCDVEPCQSGYKCQNNQCVQDSPCGPYKVLSPSGCILSCNAPELRSCPDVINTLIYDPQYCGLGANGRWQSYTHICQACNSGGVGVKEGKCSCRQLGCRYDQICDRGYCENPTNSSGCKNNYDCPSGYFCSNGQCADKCIVTLCPYGYQCEKGQCIKISQCPCPYGFSCVSDKCVKPNPCSSCKGYELCINNQCVDKCLSTTCPVGSICEKGQCKSRPQCTFDFDRQCKSYEFCLNGTCTDKCAYIRCSPGYICKFGGCMPNNECNSNSDCSSGFVCTGGRCVDQCAGVNCPLGYTCKFGRCTSDNVCSKPCTYGQVCRNGECVDPCIFTTCPTGTYCRNGDCLDSCALVKCGTGYYCKEGSCVKDPNVCLSNGECDDGKYCYFGTCRDKCERVTCGSGEKCVLGKCEPEFDFCPSYDTANVQYCKLPRYTEKQCPVVYYFRAPDPAYCGVLADGTRKDFARECEACKDTGVVYYFDVPCHKAPFVCTKQENCLDYYCGEQHCYAHSDCPYDWQTCFQNKCIDRCSLLKCANCKFGQCGYQPPYGKCFTDKDCPNNWNCAGFNCVDKCWNKKCPAGHKCWNGECEKE